MPEELVPSTFVPRVLAYVAAHGGDAEGLIARFGLPRNAHTLATVLVPMKTTHDVAEAAAEAIGDPLLGLHIGVSVQNRLQGILGIVASSAPTVGEALDRLIRYQDVMPSAAKLSLERPPGRRRDGEEFAVTYDAPGYDEGVGRHNAEFAIAKFVHGLREISNELVVPRRIWFSHEPPVGSLGPYIDIFGTEQIEFGSRRSAGGAAFDSRLLDLAVITARPDLLPVVEKMAEAQLAAADAERDLLAAVRRAVRGELGSGEPTLERLAPKLGTSARTLQRRLRERGVTFHALVEDVRRDLAVHYLRDVGMDIDGITSALGYAQPEAFARAFRRWTGTSPIAYRKACSQGRTTPVEVN